MKTTIERSAFLKALNHVQSVVERRNTIPILSNVLLEAENGVVTLTATDLGIEVRERVEAEIAQAGAITAPAHMLYDIVRKLPDGVILDVILLLARVFLLHNILDEQRSVIQLAFVLICLCVHLI